MIAALSLLCACFVVLVLVGEYLSWPRVTALAKLAASSTFVWLALRQGALMSVSGALILLGLVLCWCGDLLLLSRGQSRLFRLGIAAFLLAHVAYAAAFVNLGVDGRTMVSALFVCTLAALGVLRWLMPHVPPGFRLAVPVYVAAIFVMVAAACGAAASGAPVALMIGAGIFALSDLAVARQRFVQPALTNRALGLPLYYAAQLLIADACGTLASV